MLFLVSACGIRIVSTHTLRDVLAPSHNTTARKFRTGVSDCARVFCGDELQDEQSTYVAWDTLGRATSSKKQRLFRTDRPHSLHGLSPTDVRRIAVVEDNISVVCRSGETLLLSPHGTLIDHQNIFIEPSTQKKTGLALHVGRPPLPSHVVELVVYRSDSGTTTAPSTTISGCRAWFATSSIDRDSLLRNEIRFDVSAIAIRLCELNEWDSTHVQDTTLRIALQESPEQVYTSIEEVFLRETLAGGASALTALVYSPGKARVTAMSADITIRPISSLQLLCRLVRVVCSKFDHCPDDIQARSTLRVLMTTTIRVATLLLHHRACAHQHNVEESATPTALEKYTNVLQKIGVPLVDIANITPPTATMFMSIDDHDGADPSFADIGAAVREASQDVADDELLVANDVYVLSSVIHGLRVGIEHVPEGTPIVIASSALPWFTRVCDYGVLPAVVSTIVGKIPVTEKQAPNKASPVKLQQSLLLQHQYQQQQRTTEKSTTLPAAPTVTTEVSTPSTWATFAQYVCALLQDKSRGVASICLQLRGMTHDLSPSLLEMVSSVIIREAAPAASNKPAGGGLKSPKAAANTQTTTTTTAADLLDVGGLLVSNYNVWQLAHLQRVVGFIVMERVVQASALPSTTTTTTSTTTPPGGVETQQLLVQCNELLSKVYGRTRAAQWWGTLYHKTSKDSIRSLAITALSQLHQISSGTTGTTDVAVEGDEGQDENETKTFFSTIEAIMSTIPEAIRPVASEGTLSRVVHSRLLFSHGAFITDRKGMATSAMPHNTSFLLLHEEDGDGDDGGDGSEAYQGDYQQRVRDLAARAGQKPRPQGEKLRPQQTISGPKDVVDVHAPTPTSFITSSTKLGATRPLLPLYDPQQGGESIVLGSLAMLKPTQPLPYTDFALEWVHWSTFDAPAPQIESGGGRCPSLFEPPLTPWDSVALEQLLFLRRDSQVSESALRKVLLQQLLPGACRDEAHRQLTRESHLFSVMNYCFRHFDVEAFMWICSALFHSQGGEDHHHHHQHHESDFVYIRGIILSTLHVIELELRATPESATLLNMQSGWCRCALHLLGLTSTSKGVAAFEGQGGEQLLEDTLKPWGALLPLLLSKTNSAEVDGEIRQAVVGHVLRHLSSAVPTATVRLCSTLLQASPEAWRRVKLQEALMLEDGHENETIPAPQLEALLQFFALQSVSGGALEDDDGGMHHRVDELQLFGQWLASTSAALVLLPTTDNNESDASSPPKHILAASTSFERLLETLRHTLATTTRSISIHPLLPSILSLLTPPHSSHVNISDLTKEIATRRDDGAELIANVTVSSAKSTEAAATAATEHTTQTSTMTTTSLRELLVGSACALGATHNNEFWTFRLRTNRDDSSEVIFRRVDGSSSSSTSAAAATTMALTTASVANFVLNPSAQKATQESIRTVIEQLPRWSAVPPLVKVSEPADDVSVDMWALILDGRPLSAYQRWVASKPTSMDQRFMISAARAIAFQQHSRLELHASIAAFLQLVDTQEFERFLLDCSVLARVSGLVVPGDDAPTAASGKGSVAAIMPALTAARHLTMLSPPIAGLPRSQEEQSAIRMLLDALEASNATAAVTSSGSATNIRGKLLTVHFVATYQSPSAALSYFFDRIATGHMTSGDWASTLTVAWACGISTEQWISLPHNVASKATTPMLMYATQTHATVSSGTSSNSNNSGGEVQPCGLSVCDMRDWARRHHLPADHHHNNESVQHAALLLETIATGQSNHESQGIAADDNERSAAQQQRSLTVASNCAAVLVANDKNVLPRAVVVLRYIASIAHQLGVVSSAESAAASIRDRAAAAAAPTTSPSQHAKWTGRDDEDVMQVLLAVMKSRDVAISCATRTSLKSLWHDHYESQEDDEVAAATTTSSTLSVLDVVEPMLLLHEALLNQTYGAALRVLASLTEALSECELDAEVISLFLFQLAQLHLLPNAATSSDHHGGDSDLDDDGDGDDDDAHLHANLFNALGVILKALEQWRHVALSAPIVTWLRVSLLVSDGDVPTASARCKATAAAFLCCRPILKLLMDVLEDPSRGSQITAPQVMMACLNRHPKLAAECLQELSSTVDGLPSASSGSTPQQQQRVAGPFVVAVRLVEDMMFHSGLFSCEAEHAQLLQVSLDAAVNAIPSSTSLALNALVHCLLSHTTTDETTVTLCSHLVNAALSSLATRCAPSSELSPLAMENISNCDAFLRAIHEHLPCEGSSVPKVVYRILLGTIAETDEAKQIAATFANAPLTRNPLLSSEVITAVLPVARHRPPLRAWLRRHFATDISTIAPPSSEASAASSAAPMDDDPIAFVEDYVSGDIIDEAKALMDRAEALHTQQQQHSGTSSDGSSARIALQRDQDTLLWKCTSSVLSRCMQENGIQQLVPFLATFPTNPLSANNALASLQQLLNQSVFCILRSHYVPLMHDISQRLFARDKKYPTALGDFELSLTQFFFVAAADIPATQQYQQANFFGLGEASGWLCKERILAICSMLQQLQPLLDAARSLNKHNANSVDESPPGTPPSSRPQQPLAGVTNLVSAFAESIIAQCNRFQSFVKLPSRSHYPRLFLEPLVMMLVHGYWILQRHFDEGLAAILTKELLCVMNVCGHDGDLEQMRRIVFAVGDIGVLEYVVNCIPVSQLVTLANSSPDFQLQPLHRSTMRVAIMSFFDRLSRQEDFLSVSRVEMTTLYANFRHFTALGDRLEHEAHHMLQGFIAQHSTQKKGLLDSQKDALRRQNRMLDEIDTRFLSAANFFVQDSQFERSLACIRDLYLIQVQKKTSSIKVLGLEQEQAVQVMANQLDNAQDVIAVGYGYQITDHADWAAVLYRQVVHRGKKDIFTAYRAQAVSLSPSVRKALIDMWRADTASHKDSAKKQAWQWLDDEMQRNSGQ
ncbi:Hypothetical protein, putative [Bodo saltans]|uniref:Spatacsin C-terminal domain-containing protein n=1 Tax=Bodo saltans TaxID=75058 RepID=A0A0S4JCL6_BODSA|nr:Hypothetical protein, putative [Bodo saltans]|eukprot:CUG87239.1 Hypothetical protein, putative [Bodo saltans]